MIECLTTNHGFDSRHAHLRKLCKWFGSGAGFVQLREDNSEINLIKN